MYHRICAGVTRRYMPTMERSTIEAQTYSRMKETTSPTAAMPSRTLSVGVYIQFSIISIAHVKATCKPFVKGMSKESAACCQKNVN